MNISKNDKVSIGITAAAGVAGTTDIEGATIDMSGYEGVLMIFTFGVITGSAVTSIKAQQDTASGMGTAADLEGTGQTIADTDDEKIFYIDLYKPEERYVRGYVDRATQNAVVTMSYIQYGASKMPVTHGTNVSGETHISPDEGTA
jgi:hypothetical protein